MLPGIWDYLQQLPPGTFKQGLFCFRVGDLDFQIYSPLSIRAAASSAA